MADPASPLAVRPHSAVVPGPPTDTAGPSGATESLSLSSPSSCLFGHVGGSLGADLWNVSITPTVGKVNPALLVFSDDCGSACSMINELLASDLVQNDVLSV